MSSTPFWGLSVPVDMPSLHPKNIIQRENDQSLLMHKDHKIDIQQSSDIRKVARWKALK
jgi:hypothetical protein